MDDVPVGFPEQGTQVKKKQWLKRVAQEIVHHCEQGFPKEDMEAARKIMENPARIRENEPLPGEDDAMGFCKCGEGTY